MNDQPVNFAFVENLITAVKIENTAEDLGFQFMHWQKPSLDEQDAGGDSETQWAEPLRGIEGAVIEEITMHQPALIIFDLGNQSVPTLDWIALITSVPATRGIPILAYGPHVEKEKLAAAKAAGATAAIARSKLMMDIPGVLSEYAKVIDIEQIQGTCLDELPHLAKRGLEEFNRGEYFRAHDSLELAWMGEQSAGRELYRAILQVAVAYYQIVRGNYNGAAKMLLRMRKWLYPLPGMCRGINIDQLRNDVDAVHAELIALGPDGMDQFNLELLKPVEYTEIY
jgi:CheY-like chemotaxis protein